MVYDFIVKQTLDSHAMLVPIHQMCLDLELTRAAQAIHLLLAGGTLPTEICEIRTDAVYACPAQRKQEAIKDRLNSITQKELCDLQPDLWLAGMRLTNRNVMRRH